MRFQNKKISARATALALVLGVVGVLLTALPALAAVPIVTSLTPATGAPGTSVQINGSGFISSGTVSAVTFNGIAATSYVVNSDILITAVAPCSTDGNVHVTTTGGVDVNTVAFDYTTPGAPTITSFLPTGGAVGTSVIITGTNLCGASPVAFNTTNATSVVVNSATQITAVVPTGATTGPIHVTTPIAPPAVSSANFTVGAAPTITSFTPTSGPVGTSVVITGTNLTGVTGVKFNGVTATFSANTATSVTAVVPTGATTGKISVTTGVSTVTSTTDFTVTTGPIVTKHNRSVTLELKKHLVASGTVKIADGFNACRSHVTVKIQRLKNGEWVNVGSDETTGDGKYKETLDDKTGKYRAVAKKKTLNGGDDVCKVDESPTKKHQH